jgi:hypothetical protein
LPAMNLVRVAVRMSDDFRRKGIGTGPDLESRRGKAL